jgi:predicted LPLAT superfamily acyltransferase
MKILFFSMLRMAAVKDFDSWIASYKDRKQPALRMDPTNGSLLVTDPKDSTKILKTFPMRRGYDLITLFKHSHHLEEATKTLQALKPAYEERLELAKETFQRLEKELLAKIYERRSTTDPMIRIKITQKIGELQRDLAIASEAVQKTITPVRYALEAEVMKNVLDPDTRKETYQIISIAKTYPYTFEERSIPIEAKKV